MTGRADAEAADKAVSVLTDWAGQFDPTLLRKLGTRILDHVAPDLADAAAHAAVDADARRADRDRHLTLSEQTDGRLRLTGTLDAETAGLFRAAIDPLTAPRTGRLPVPRSTPPRRPRRHLPTRPAHRRAARQRRRFRPDRRHHQLRRADPAAVHRRARHRPTAHARDRAPARLRRHHPARRPRRRWPGPRRRPTTPPHHRAAPPRPRAARPRLRLPRLRPTTALVRRPPHPPLGRRRHHQPRQRGSTLRPPPPTRPPDRLGRPARRRRPSGVHSTLLARPRTAPPPQPLPPTNIGSASREDHPSGPTSSAPSCRIPRGDLTSSSGEVLASGIGGKA